MSKCQKVWLDYKSYDFKSCGKETENKERNSKGKVVPMCHDCVKRQKLINESLKNVRLV